MASHTFISGLKRPLFTACHIACHLCITIYLVLHSIPCNAMNKFVVISLLLVPIIFIFYFRFLKAVKCLSLLFCQWTNNIYMYMSEWNWKCETLFVVVLFACTTIDSTFPINSRYLVIFYNKWGAAFKRECSEVRFNENLNESTSISYCKENFARLCYGRHYCVRW